MDEVNKSLSSLKELYKDNALELAKINKLSNEIIEFYNTGIKLSLSHINEANKNAELIHQMEEFSKKSKAIEEELEKDVNVIEKNIDGIISI